MLEYYDFKFISSPLSHDALLHEKMHLINTNITFKQFHISNIHLTLVFLWINEMEKVINLICRCATFTKHNESRKIQPNMAHLLRPFEEHDEGFDGK